MWALCGREKGLVQRRYKAFPHFSILYLLPLLTPSPFQSLSSPIPSSCTVLCNSQGCLPLSPSLSFSLHIFPQPKTPNSCKMAANLLILPRPDHSSFLSSFSPFRYCHDYPGHSLLGNITLILQQIHKTPLFWFSFSCIWFLLCDRFLKE